MKGEQKEGTWRTERLKQTRERQRHIEVKGELKWQEDILANGMGETICATKGGQEKLISETELKQRQQKPQNNMDDRAQWEGG